MTLTRILLVLVLAVAAVAVFMSTPALADDTVPAPDGWSWNDS